LGLCLDRELVTAVTFSNYAYSHSYTTCTEITESVTELTVQSAKSDSQSSVLRNDQQRFYLQTTLYISEFTKQKASYHLFSTIWLNFREWWIKQTLRFELRRVSEYEKLIKARQHYSLITKSSKKVPNRLVLIQSTNHADDQQRFVYYLQVCRQS